MGRFGSNRISSAHKPGSSFGPIKLLIIVFASLLLNNSLKDRRALFDGSTSVSVLSVWAVGGTRTRNSLGTPKILPLNYYRLWRCTIALYN